MRDDSSDRDVIDAADDLDSSSDHRGVEPAEQAAAMMTAAGMARMPARVMMALVAAPEGGYTAAQLGERLGVSAAAVSGAVRYLQQLHFIQRRSRPGDRRDRYEFVHDPFYASIVGNMPVYSRLSEYIDAIAAEQSEDDGARERAEELAEFFRFLSVRMLQIVEDWRDLRRDA
ncbi:MULTISPECIES: GbsR/MarR family transcriptional regulator [unclassified Microbacterium]|uniref:GbsR/MarR family transcriptional regulator n=1 Tax=unclassified Microbacterium TaxID=2609290 RepID=UPI001604D38B|nr:MULTISPECIES: MarR family transcriptional regulator [unclassified Microbacterium]QNA91319.1 MarR family transcriptional regulator [Microbacterium sp. Se63.02b]QYM64477.1 MarR family transcriptional regulator [Microbacterium sp. Se5.02b]